MRRSFALLIIMVVIVLIAYVTKPSNETCLTEARKQYKESVINKLSLNLPANINEKLLSETLQKSFEQSLSVQDKVVYKDILQQKGNVKVSIGWGAFGIASVDIK